MKDKDAFELPLITLAIFLQNVICAEGKDVVSFETLSKGDTSQWPHLENMVFDPYQDIVILLYSSGTTGSPKGVPMTHHSVLFRTTQNRYFHFMLSYHIFVSLFGSH